MDMSLLSVRCRREELLRIEASKAEEERKRSVESKLCCICLTEERTTLILPCKHMCLCSKCGKDDRLSNCPICREEIEQVMEIFA